MSLIKLEFLKDYNKIYISDTRINIKSVVQKINLNIVNKKGKENRCGWRIYNQKTQVNLQLKPGQCEFFPVLQRVKTQWFAISEFSRGVRAEGVYNPVFDSIRFLLMYEDSDSQKVSTKYTAQKIFWH